MRAFVILYLLEHVVISVFSWLCRQVRDLTLVLFGKVVRRLMFYPKRSHNPALFRYGRDHSTAHLVSQQVLKFLIEIHRGPL